jgi:3-hydroxyacyl-CoA dehydrogenase
MPGELIEASAPIAVIGAGTMGAGIAQVAAVAGHPVLVYDAAPGAAERAVDAVRMRIAALVAKGRLDVDPARLRLDVARELDELAPARCVVEAVVEDLAVKQALFADLEKVVTPGCVLATNTSSLSVTAMAANLAHPERVVGFHFFNPVAVLPLVEVVRGERTGDAAVATALDVGKTLKKNCVIVADRPAFVVNRLLTRFLGEIIGTVDEGTGFEVAEHAADPLGLPMSPFLLLQLVGPKIAVHVAETLAAAFPGRFAVSDKLRAVADSGRTSVYRPDFSVDPDVIALLAGGDRPSTGPEVLARAVEGLAQEIRIMLDEGVVAAAEDIDLCMILGAGWPFHLGGITPYLDRTGVSAKVNGAPFR